MREVVITSAVRTPNGSFNGTLSQVGATKLGAIAIEEAIRRSNIEKTQVNEVIMGLVLPCGYGQNPAKQAAVQAGLPWDVGCITINKVCGSALKAVSLAAQAIQTGDADVIVAGGILFPLRVEPVVTKDCIAFFDGRHVQAPPVDYGPAAQNQARPFDLTQ